MKADSTNSLTAYNSTVLDKIHSSGYWRVNLRPTQFDDKRIPDLNSLKEIIQKCQVNLREPPYPIYPLYEGELLSFGNDYIEAELDIDDYFEFWRFYQSGQFIHHFSMEEDYYDIERLFPSGKIHLDQKNGGFLIREWTLHILTEIYEFSSRLFLKGALGESLEISVKLINTNGRKIITSDSPIFHLRFDTRCNQNEVAIEDKLNGIDLIARSNDYALEATQKIYEQFNFYKMNSKIIKEEQAKFLKRRL